MKITLERAEVENVIAKDLESKGMPLKGKVLTLKVAGNAFQVNIVDAPVEAEAQVKK